MVWFWHTQYKKWLSDRVFQDSSTCLPCLSWALGNDINSYGSLLGNWYAVLNIIVTWRSFQIIVDFPVNFLTCIWPCFEVENMSTVGWFIDFIRQFGDAENLPCHYGQVDWQLWRKCTKLPTMITSTDLQHRLYHIGSSDEGRRQEFSYGWAT